MGRIDLRTAVANAGHSLQVAYLWLHQAVYQRTGGLVGHRLAGSPSLMLRTTGRRSGSPRTAVLIYARDGADFVLVASTLRNQAGGRSCPSFEATSTKSAPSRA